MSHFKGIGFNSCGEIFSKENFSKKIFEKESSFQEVIPRTIPVITTILVITTIPVITSKQTNYFPFAIKVSSTELIPIQCEDLVEAKYFEAKSFVIQFKRKIKTMLGFCAELGNREQKDMFMILAKISSCGFKFHRGGC